VACIMMEWVKKFLWKSVICRFGFPHTLIVDNGSHFASTNVCEFFQSHGIRLIFTYIEHPQSNGQVEAAKKVVLYGIKKQLEKTWTSWIDELPRILWSYYTTPHSSIHEPLFTLVYEADAMILIEIVEPTFQVDFFNEERSDNDQRAYLDTTKEV